MVCTYFTNSRRKIATLYAVLQARQRLRDGSVVNWVHSFPLASLAERMGVDPLDSLTFMWLSHTMGQRFSVEGGMHPIIIRKLEVEETHPN